MCPPSSIDYWHVYTVQHPRSSLTTCNEICMRGRSCQISNICSNVCSLRVSIMRWEWPLKLLLFAPLILTMWKATMARNHGKMVGLLIALFQSNYYDLPFLSLREILGRLFPSPFSPIPVSTWGCNYDSWNIMSGTRRWRFSSPIIPINQLTPQLDCLMFHGMTLNVKAQRALSQKLRPLGPLISRWKWHDGIKHDTFTFY